MDLISSRIRFDKETIYDRYLRIVYNNKDYESVTRKEMLKEIIETYHLTDFMYYICTSRERDFICQFYGKTISEKEIKKYYWEMVQLNDKLIFNLENLSFYEDYDDVIPLLISYTKKNKQEDFPLSMFIVSMVRINGELLTKALEPICMQVYKIGEQGFNAFLGNPLVHYFCSFDIEEVNGQECEFIYFRDYEDDIYLLRDSRKKLGVAGSVPFEKQLFIDFYYYGLNYSNPKVKKMYDKVNSLYINKVLLSLIDRCRVLGIPFDFNIDDEELSNCINDALLEIPCAAMNGLTPKQRNDAIVEKEDLKKYFVSVPQNNAHVHKSIAKMYYYCYFALLEFVNNKYHITDKIKEIFKQNSINPSDINDIDRYLWEHIEVIDEFISENPYKFTLEELNYVKQFKTVLKQDSFIFIGTDREFAKFLSDDGKIYMVKGLNSDLDDVLDVSKAPALINTHLLMFEGFIIYSGIINTMNIDLGNNFILTVVNDLKNAINYYHF